MVPTVFVGGWSGYDTAGDLRYLHVITVTRQ